MIKTYSIYGYKNGELMFTECSVECTQVGWMIKEFQEQGYTVKVMED